MKLCGKVVARLVGESMRHGAVLAECMNGRILVHTVHQLLAGLCVVLCVGGGLEYTTRLWLNICHGVAV